MELNWPAEAIILHLPHASTVLPKEAVFLLDSHSQKPVVSAPALPKIIDRPSTPSMGRQIGGQAEKNADAPTQQWATSDFDEWDDAFSDMPKDETPSNSNVTIDVKPLPKLRLDLMPAPREEDEDDISTI